MNQKNQCKDTNRQTDSVANVFWRQLMKVKEALMCMEHDLDSQAKWILANLCDGEDDKNEALQNDLEDLSMGHAL